jgi:putative PIN family toxin of toxin-antitoxin system
MLRAVIDTNVLFEGLTKLGACAQIVDAWVERRFVPCVSTALALEYEEVLVGKLEPEKRRVAMGAMVALLNRAEYTPVTALVRPLSRDPDDDFVIECAFNGKATIVTRNIRDLAIAQEALGLDVLTPEEFLSRLEM